MMDNLPNEILVKIFNHLNILDRISFRRVSRRWYSLCLQKLDELFVGPVHSNSRNFNQKMNWNVKPENRIFLQLNQRKKINSVFCHLLKTIGVSLRKVKFDDYYESKQHKNRSPFVSRHRTKYFQSFAHALIQNCPNLISLSIYLKFNKNGIRVSAIKKLIQHYGPQLEELHLFIPKTISVYKYLNPSKLRKLTANLRNGKQLKFLCENFSLLTELTMAHDIIDSEETYQHFFKLKQLKKIHLNGHLHRNIFEIFKNSGDFVANLQRFSFDRINLINREETHGPSWAEFKSLRFFSSSIYPRDKFEQTLTTYLSNLEELSFLFSYIPYDFFDLNVFSSLKCLKKLTVNRYLTPSQLNYSQMNFETIEAPLLSVETLSLFNIKSVRFGAVLEIEMKVFKQIGRVFPSLRVFHVACWEISSENLKLNCLEKLHHLEELFIQTDNKKTRYKTPNLPLSEYRQLFPYCKSRKIDFKLA